MRQGLLWYDDDPKHDLAAKIRAAKHAYQARHRHAANTCYVHPSALPRTRVIAGIRVVPKHNVLRHHFWIGMEHIK